ncbi:class I SAM-dependent DNA methyltransferase [Anaerosphaera multitolerans]|uniref:Class I SAM-dependent methyltransferase n=1 Tax=Anaerosphaera multitolerans TaxID=2487351 RepID=A0A437S789_9FIRM|nr:methyltransferase domain-containing protein [Anaerosphaera multitolerans]RVU54903.1 class I SAM-dependent methyltransferase [Anaerosphaera multitolerans]
MVYNQFAQIYDKLMYDFDYDKVYNFIDDVYRNSGIKSKKLLELGCGTGNLTEKLLLEFEVDAVDLSVDMLSILSNKIRSDKLRIFNHNMKDFKSDRIYDMVVSCCDSLNYIIVPKEIEETFKNTFSLLKDGGIFIFDLNTEYKFLNMEKTYVEEVDGIFYVWENFFNDTSKENIFSVNFFVEKNNLYERFYEEHIERAYDNSFIVNALKKSGFKEVSVYNEYNNSNTELKDSNRLVYVARR